MRTHMLTMTTQSLAKNRRERLLAKRRDKELERAMRSNGTLMRGLIALTMLIGMFARALTVSAAPAADVAENTYTSPQFGCQITWNDNWYVVEESSEDYDYLGLTDGTGYANVIANDEAGGSALVEYAFIVGDLRTDPAVSNLEKVLGDDGQPIERVSPERAFGAFTYTYTDGDFSVEFTTYIETRTIVPGESVVVFYAFAPTEYYSFESSAFQELLSTLDCNPSTPVNGEPAPVFVTGQWRVAVASASLDTSFDDPKLKAKSGKEWLIVVADVTNWSTADGVFSGREITLQAGPDGKTVKAAPGSSKAVTKRLGLEPMTDDELNIQIPAFETKRVVLVYQVPARSSELMLVRETAMLPLENTQALTLAFDPDALAPIAVPPVVVEGAFVAASDGRTVKIQLDGEADAQKMRLLGVKPPAKGDCYANEAKAMLKSLVGQRVMVEEDANVTGGSTPRYVWLLNVDGTRTLLNEALISSGLATVDKLPKDARFGAFLRGSQLSAEAAPTGLWLDCTEKTATAAATATPTKSPTVKATPTKSATAPATATPTKSASVSATATPAASATKTATATASDTTAVWVDSDNNANKAKTTYDVTLRDINYDVTELLVPANSTITINLTNEGVAIHTFNIDALNVHSGDYQPGESGTVTFRTAGPGTYVFYCSNPGHRQAGMAGTLIVVAQTDS